MEYQDVYSRQALTSCQVSSLTSSTYATPWSVSPVFVIVSTHLQVLPFFRIITCVFIPVWTMTSLGKAGAETKPLVDLTNKSNWHRQTENTGINTQGIMGKMGDTWRGVETITKTGGTDQGVEMSCGKKIYIFSYLVWEVWEKKIYIFSDLVWELWEL